MAEPSRLELLFPAAGKVNPASWSLLPAGRNPHPVTAGVLPHSRNPDVASVPGVPPPMAGDPDEAGARVFLGHGMLRGQRRSDLNRDEFFFDHGSRVFISFVGVVFLRELFAGVLALGVFPFAVVRFFLGVMARVLVSRIRAVAVLPVGGPAGHDSGEQHGCGSK